MLLRTLAFACAFIAVPLGAQAQSATGATTPNYAPSMSRLQDAAERLREAIQAMAAQPAGPGRSKAAEAAREALLETQHAMLQLPG